MTTTMHRPRSLWRHRDFLTYWVGDTVSSLGTQVTFVALPLVALLTLDVTTRELGVLRFAEYLPFLALTLLFGVWADRRRRRPLMIAVHVIRGALVAIVPVLALFGIVRFPVLVAVAFAVGTCTALFEVCWLSYVPSLVPSDRLVDAIGKVATSHSAAEVAGPALGGLLVQLATAPFALIVDAVSYLFAAASLVIVRHREPDPVDPAKASQTRTNMLAELGDGLRFAFRQPYIRATAFCAAQANFFGLLTETVFLQYAVRELQLRPGLLGLVLSTVGAGGILGAAFANGIITRFPVGRVYVTARLVSGGGVLLLPLAGGSTTTAVATCMASFFIWQAALANSNVVNASLRQAMTPEHLRGRMNASVRTLVFGALPLGGLAGGLFGDLIGLRAALWLGAIGYTASVVPILLSPLPRLRTVPTMGDR